MKTRAAILREVPGVWKVEEVELDEPEQGEVLVEMASTGLCHSDDHIARGDLSVAHLPVVGGHEGSGVVRHVGPGVRGLEVGDHIVTSFLPVCGSCRWCAMGMQHLCDRGSLVLRGHQLDGTFRMRTSDGLDLGTISALGTFSEWQVYDQASCVKIEKDIPLEVACLVACGVQAGVGSATRAGNVQPGDVVVVIGVGGVGMNAVQGARLCGAGHIIAIDPVPEKQKWALGFGASDSFKSISDGMDRIRQLSNNQGADVVIVTAGLVRNDLIGEAFEAVRKAGTLVVAGLGPEADDSPMPGVNASNLALFQKRIQGALYGGKSPREAIPALLDLYRAGKLQLDELVTHVYTLDEINIAYQDLHTGRLIRGVVDL